MSLISKVAKQTLRVVTLPASLAYAVQTIIKRRKCQISPDAKLHRSCRILNMSGRPSNIRIGAGTHIYGDLLILRHGGTISIGQDSFVSEDTRIWSGEKVTIGNRVLVSHGVNIHDTNSHSLSAKARHIHYKSITAGGHPLTLEDVGQQAVTIEDDAWIGFGSAIFKGVTIGQGAIVAAMSVVTKDVPPFTIVAGNPAKPVGTSRP